MLKTVEYIREHGLDKLIKNFSLTAKRHQLYPNLVQLKYDQLESEMSSPIVQECRGLLLDEKDNWKVLSYPYSKFFNYNEKNASTDKIDWKTAKVYEKMDGALSIMYWYEDAWHIGTSGRPDALGLLHKSRGTENEGMTIKDLFWEIWNKLNYKLPKEEDRDKCFMFELLSSRSRVVIMHKEDQIFLHGVREMNSLSELEPTSFASKYNWNLVPVFEKEFHNLDEVVEASKKLDITYHEGFVVCDAKFNRVKVKSPQFVVFSLMNWRDKDGLNKRRMLEVVRINEGSEFLSYFPQWKELYTHLKMRFDELCQETQQILDNGKELTDKEFAKYVTKYPKFNKLLWGIRSGMIPSVKVGYLKMEIKKLECLLPKEEINTLGPDPNFGLSMEELQEQIAEEKIKEIPEKKTSRKEKKKKMNKEENKHH